MYTTDEKTRQKLFVFILAGISLLARLLFLGRKSLWIDECLAWGATRMTWPDMFASVVTGTPHPPGAFALIKLSSLLAGDSEFGLRLLVAVAVSSAVIPVFRLASRRTTVQGGFWAGMVWAVSPFVVSLGQEAWVYGVTAALSMWFADTADMAWRGSQKAFVGSLVLGAAGLLTQHIFVLSVTAGCVLYFTIESGKRIPFKRFIAVPGILTVFYAPIILYFSRQFSLRNSRMISAGVYPGFSRFSGVLPVSQFFRLLAGGILPEISENLLERPRMLTAFTVNAITVLFLTVRPFFTGMLKPAERKYLWLALLIPFGLFITDEPGVRQLSVLWIPFSLTSAAVFSKQHWSGAAVSIMCVLALVPYYSMETYPYHRSNWRAAVAAVESLAKPEDIVVVFGGKSTSFAWQYYSGSELTCITPSGNLPFAEDGQRVRIDPETLLDSLFLQAGYNRVWVVLDVWGIPSVHSIKGQHSLMLFRQIGEHMQVALLKDEYIQQ
jgi:hypothetical protein